jgi:hypothetical protein
MYWQYGFFLFLEASLSLIQSVTDLKTCGGVLRETDAYCSGATESEELVDR